MRYILDSLVWVCLVADNLALSPQMASRNNKIISDTQEMMLIPPPLLHPLALAPTSSSVSTTSRSQFLSLVAAATIGWSAGGDGRCCWAFEGGVGGLGKTKPETGVQFFSDLSSPLQNSAGIVSAELNVANQPVLVTFQSPWPLLSSTAGLEARDLQQPESAYVQVVTEGVPKQFPLTKQSMKQILMASVFNAQGKVCRVGFVLLVLVQRMHWKLVLTVQAYKCKFSAYGQPVDIKVKETDDPTIFAVSFTTFTPGMKESDRLALIKYCPVGNAIILLITGTTSVRYKKQGVVIQQVAKSFNAVVAPSSRLR